MVYAIVLPFMTCAILYGADSLKDLKQVLRQI